MNRALCVVFVAMLLCTFSGRVSASQGYEVTSYEVTVTPLGGTEAFLEVTMGIVASEASVLNVSFGYPLSSLEVDVPDGISYDYRAQEYASELDIYLPSEGASVISIRYQAPVLTFVDDNTYVYSPTFSFDSVGYFSCKVFVPPGMSIVAPVAPTPQQFSTEGSSFIVAWERVHHSGGLYLLLGLKEEQPDSSLPLFMVAGFFLLCGLVAGMVISSRKQPPHPPAADFKTDEARVVDLLSSGPVTQADLVERTGFSKAKVSRLVMELEARHVVSKERYGTKNIVRLMR